jgi:hypothetical protein
LKTKAFHYQNEKDESNAIVITQNLCSEKLNILMKALSGQSFFFTGAAGNSLVTKFSLNEFYNYF